MSFHYPCTELQLMYSVTHDVLYVHVHVSFASVLYTFFHVHVGYLNNSRASYVRS